jgi:hypothetical protein
VTADRWKYVEYRNGERELYDHSSDPFELENLALSFEPEHRRRATELAARLLELRAE